MNPLSLWCGHFRSRRKAGGATVTDGVVQVLGPCVGGDVHVGSRAVGWEGGGCSVHRDQGDHSESGCKFLKSGVCSKPYLKSHVYEP